MTDVSREEFEKLQALVHALRWEAGYLRRQLYRAGSIDELVPMDMRDEISAALDQARESAVAHGASEEDAERSAELIREALDKVHALPHLFSL